MPRITVEKALYYKEQLTKRYNDHHITAYSAQMAYFFVLSIFPLIIFIFSILSKLNLTYQIGGSVLEYILPSDASGIITDFIEHSINVGSSTTTTSVSGLITLYAASRAVNALQRAVNTAYNVTETRGFIKTKLMGMLYTFMFTILIVLTLAIPDMADNILKLLDQYIRFPLDSEMLTSAYFIRNLTLVVLYIIVFGSIYVFLPSKRLTIKEAYRGALVGIVGTLIATFIFSNFVVKATSYSLLYGSLSLVIAFMVWLYFASMIIMAGAEINAISLELKKED